MARQNNTIRSSLARHGAAGALLVVVVAGGLTAWGLTTEVAGAIVATGAVTVEGGSKLVQHQQGGTIDQILVGNEDSVKAGQVLVRMDGTAAAANLEVVVSQLRSVLARQARLLAEVNGQSLIVLPPSAQSWSKDAELARLLGEQDRLIVVRAAAREGKIASLGEQINQLQLQVDGLGRQRSSLDEQLAIVETELASIEQLVEQGLVVASRRSTLERQRSELAGQTAQIESQSAQVAASIEGQRLTMVQMDDEFRAQVMEELQAANDEVARLTQQKISAEDVLARLEIRAPIDGVVHELKVHTVGGVVGAGETLMTIVPQQVEHLIDARLSPIDIDNLRVGQGARLKFSSLDPRKTPELEGTVKAVSPDLMQDPATKAQYYAVRVEIPDDQLSRLPEGSRIMPGMPVTVFVQAGSRTVFAYLMQPLIEQMSLVFREQ